MFIPILRPSAICSTEKNRQMKETLAAEKNKKWRKKKKKKKNTKPDQCVWQRNDGCVMFGNEIIEPSAVVSSSLASQATRDRALPRRFENRARDIGTTVTMCACYTLQRAGGSLVRTRPRVTSNIRECYNE